MLVLTTSWRKSFRPCRNGGIADIEELNKILERAVNLKNFLKARSG